MHVIIIGNGIAGINVASALSVDASLSIDVYALETHQMYSRVRLPEVLSGLSTPEQIAFYKPDWYEKKRIAVHTGIAVSSINREAKTLTLSDGKTVSYDYLVFATGASANRPGIPGATLPGVFTLRTMDDVATIRAHLASFPSSASVIGGGLLGLEAARALKDGGASSVRVLEIAPRLLPRQLDETGASLLAKRFTAMGIEVLCGVETDSFIAGSAGAERATAIKLKDGRIFPSDTTLLSMGVHSNTELAKAAGLTVARGIVVDNQLRTSDPFIFAVGDCAEFEGIVWGIIPAALEQAPILAKAILASSGLLPVAQAPLYTQTVPKTALKVGDIELMSLGKAVLSAEELASGIFTLMSTVWDDSSRYEKFVLTAVTEIEEDGSTSYNEHFLLCGAILYGSKKHQSQVQKMMGQKVTRTDIEKLLAD